jgi:hypothetical protein
MHTWRSVAHRRIAVVFFGHDVVFPLLAPMGLAQLAMCVWLLTKGFARQADAAF